MTVTVLLLIVFAVSFSSIINGVTIDEKEIFENFSTDLQKLKELVAERKAEYDSNTQNVSIFQGIKHFRTSGGYSSLSRTRTNVTLGELLSNYTSYAVNNEDYEQEIAINDEELQVLSVKNVTRGISPDLLYESWNIEKNTFSKWSDVNVTIVLENQPHTTSYSVTNETDESLVLTLRRPYKVRVPPQSKVRVTTTIYSGVKSMLFAVELNLGIKSKDYKTSFSDDEVKTAAEEFFGSEYWQKENSTEDWTHLNIIKTYNGIALKNFPFVVRKTKFNLKRDVGEAEPL